MGLRAGIGLKFDHLTDLARGLLSMGKGKSEQGSHRGRSVFPAMNSLSYQTRAASPAQNRHAPTTGGLADGSYSPVPTERAASPTIGPRQLDGSRLFDLIVSSLLVVVLSPVFVLIGLKSWISTGRIFDRTPRVGMRASTFNQLVFAGAGFGRQLPTLLNVMAGNISFAGPRLGSPAECAPGCVHSSCRYSVRPGLVSPFTLQTRLGIAYRSEAELDQAFVQSRTTMGSITLVLRGTVAGILCGGQRAAPTTFKLLGIDIHNTTMKEAVAWLVGRATRGERTSMAFVNPDCLNTAAEHREYKSVLERADRVLPDGIGVYLACRIRNIALTANLNGTDLFPELCKEAVQADLSLFLLGAAPGVAQEAAANVRARFPGIRIAGTRDGYFEASDAGEVVQQINESDAEHRRDLEVPVCMGVGGLFDFYSGRIPRAPLWLRELGLEWVWRLLQEPGRMWRRYVIGNPLFLYRVIREARRKDSVERRKPLVARPGSVLVAATIASMRRGIRHTAVTGSRRAKRMTDITVSLAMLMLLSPLFIMTASLIRIESPGPVFYRQSRVGLRGRIFTMWKFRSMYIDADRRKQDLLKQNEMSGGVLFKMRRDPRITRVGRVIRRASIDELPQLWNVLVGDMSLVGPRPALPSEVSQYSLSERGRLDAVPGITCIWQVSGRSDIPFDKQVKMDLDYIYSLSLKTDLGLLAKTVPAIVSGRGAY
jgi:lipopolysaccharide/colanic/teichoic acid biosynthesis glycosyltransferase/UDP-N-acetyl-D-mannosaminuronic acid transferase (WecB/TagA/CpsF family)